MWKRINGIFTSNYTLCSPHLTPFLLGLTSQKQKQNPPFFQKAINRKIEMRNTEAATEWIVWRFQRPQNWKSPPPLTAPGHKQTPVDHPVARPQSGHYRQATSKVDRETTNITPQVNAINDPIMAESKVLTTNHSRSYSHGWNNNTMAILMAGQVVIAEEIQAVCFFLA